MKVVLVRHSAVVVDTELPATDWRLSRTGRENARRLGETLRQLDMAWCSSPEPKAVHTIENALGAHTPYSTDARLGELRRGAWTIDYPAVARRALRRPTEPADAGWELAAHGASRFHEVVTASERDIGICSHGLVMTAWLARYATGAFDAETFWARLRFPDAWVVDLGHRHTWTRLTRLEGLSWADGDC